jgi:hypothetical protein
MGSDRMELRLGGDYAWAMRGAAVIIIAGIATVGLLTAWSPQMHGHTFAAVWAVSGTFSMGLVWLYEVIWKSIGPLATVDATGLTYRTRWGLRRVCFAAVVRAEFGFGGQLRFNCRDGRSSRVNLLGVRVAERDPVIAYVRSRLPSGSCVDAVVKGDWTEALLYATSDVLLWLAVTGVMGIGWAACQSIG